MSRFGVFPVWGRGFGSNRRFSEEKSGPNHGVLCNSAGLVSARVFSPPVKPCRTALRRQEPPSSGNKHRCYGRQPKTHRQRQQQKVGRWKKSNRQKGDGKKEKRLRQCWFLGTQNCRTLLDTGGKGAQAPPRRTAHIAEEFHRASVDVAFLQETRIHGETECHERQRLLLAGPPAGSALQGRNGVGFSFSRKAERQKPGVLQQAGNASRIGRVDLEAVTLISAYAPTSGAGDEEVAEFYRDLGEAVRKVPNGNPVVIGGDFNARVGERNEETAAVLGRFMEGQRYPNRNGQCLLEFCLEHELVVANSFFQHPPHHKGSWQHPRSKKWHELDYFL
eukprot:Cvel_22415.t1-p1 / transcript=Cvel_22415.t1 / gene=Cvel_22415 / organism=Chromera_velia_CCMP2878 / gene_product=Craniofacial development protein 2, putative / transcript_product=Craniofacial development protein 2, putative / location=Cvel_scaffold2199:31548-32546(+) / protein_length=333 / sequence_SO=supercontig / SO=protein_coding / is_pseudo=false